MEFQSSMGAENATTTTSQIHIPKALPTQLRCRRNEIGEDPVHLTMLQPATVVMRSYGRWLCVHPTTFGSFFRSLAFWTILKLSRAKVQNKRLNLNWWRKKFTNQTVCYSCWREFLLLNIPEMEFPPSHDITTVHYPKLVYREPELRVWILGDTGQLAGGVAEKKYVSKLCRFDSWWFRFNRSDQSIWS